MLVIVHGGRDPAAVAKKHGLILKRTLVSDPDMAVLEAGSVDAARQAKEALSKDPAVRAVYFNPPTLNVPFSHP